MHVSQERCVCSDNIDYGITIGHRDTDNRISDCVIERNGKVRCARRYPLIHPPSLARHY